MVDKLTDLLLFVNKLFVVVAVGLLSFGTFNCFVSMYNDNDN